MSLVMDAKSGLYLPKNHVDMKENLKDSINKWLEKAINENQKLSTYFLTFHGKFDKEFSDTFFVDAPKVTIKLPPFLSNTIVFWVNNKKGLCEWLWTVPPKKHKREKLSVHFNKEGVAYLQAKGAFPSKGD